LDFKVVGLDNQDIKGWNFMEQHVYAVITGDLVGATRHSSDRIDDAMMTIQSAASDIAAWQTPPQDTRFTRYRGDGWQIVIARPSFALRAATVIQAKLIGMGMESRISIGIGKAKSLGTVSLADASGEAFEISGTQLDNMADAWRIAINKQPPQIDEDGLIASLLGERMGKWTPAQAAAAAMYLASPVRIVTLSEIAQKLGISPQAVNDRILGAGCPLIRSVLKLWEGLKTKQDWDQQDD
jgi:hypothetical protein